MQTKKQRRPPRGCALGKFPPPGFDKQFAEKADWPVIARSRRRRGILHCVENSQSEIPRRYENDCAEGALECGGLTPPWPSRSRLMQGGVKPPHSKALHAFSCMVVSQRIMESPLGMTARKSLSVVCKAAGTHHASDQASVNSVCSLVVPTADSSFAAFPTSPYQFSHNAESVLHSERNKSRPRDQHVVIEGESVAEPPVKESRQGMQAAARRTGA